MIEIGEEDRCGNCDERLIYGQVIQDEWVHWHGDKYCHNKYGFCATPIRSAWAINYDWWN